MIVLDAGAFIAVERGDRELLALLKRELLYGRVPATSGAVVGQVWRGGARQAMVARLLASCHVAPLDDAMGRRVGLLLGAAGRRDVVDASVILLAGDGDIVVTSDPADLTALAAAAGLQIDLVPV
jgi:uncharacterized protein YaiI (UPF0178 family)